MKYRAPNTGRLRLLAFPIFLILLIPALVSGQESRGRITGRILDPNGAAVPGATVIITDTERGPAVTLTSNDEGMGPRTLPGNVVSQSGEMSGRRREPRFGPDPSRRVGGCGRESADYSDHTDQSAESA